ncbi:hypothetical protein [Bacillus sp. UNC438CL73TsuS30]|uniref:hypothetical protein n=1 Tax=Bacillus sp. UNC438CL73TsuS30 TaxID=1340434 RepID=UPI00047A9371|nr:hypothetical protein [Bacillus sp. UNC438CL73TsuS30]
MPRLDGNKRINASMWKRKVIRGGKAGEYFDRDPKWTEVIAEELGIQLRQVEKGQPPFLEKPRKKRQRNQYNNKPTIRRR